MSNEFAPLPTILSSMRSYIENLTMDSEGNIIPTYTERLADEINPKSICIYLDDAQPWQGDNWKNRMFNIKVALRFSLSDLGSDYLEIHALDEAYQLLCQLEHEKIPPGLEARHYLTRCGRDESGRYVVEITLQTKSIK